MSCGIGAIRVLVADDYPLLREGIRSVIEREQGLMICGFTNDAAETLAALESLQPHVAIIAFSLRSAATFALIRDARLRHAGTPLLVLSFKDDPVLATRVSRSGAQGFIARADAKECLVEAIQQLARGLTYVSTRASVVMADRMFNSTARHPSPDGRTFTDREEEVLELIGGGFSPREIAEALRLSIKTVESHRQNIKQKLRINTSARLAQYAFQWVQSQKSN